MLLIEGIEGPQNFVRRLDFLLTPSHGRELEVEQQAPELRRRLCRSCDARDEEIVEFGIESSVTINIP